MPVRIKFGVFELDTDARELRRHGLPIRLQEQPLRVLATLLERPGETITRDELQARIWGTNTFVDFERSLNKAVNRLREALNDQAAQPTFIETVPRRGYRFIAPVCELTDTSHPPRPVVSAFVEVNKIPPPPQPRILKVAAITSALVVGLGLTAAFLWKRSEKMAIPETRHISSSASCPQLSHDGRMLAYVVHGNDGAMHVWVKQTAGGEGLQVTKGPAGEQGPDFSPDGTHIAYFSGVGISIASTLSGESRFLDKTTGGYPRYSPNGAQILYWQYPFAMVVPSEGGEPASLPLNRNFSVHSPPLWSADGSEIIFYGGKKSEPGKPEQWWAVRVATGESVPFGLPVVTPDGRTEMRSWISDRDGQDWIIYSTQNNDVWKIQRTRISPQGKINGKPETLTFGSGSLGYGVSLSVDGKLAYATVYYSESLYGIPIGSKGQKTGPGFQLSLPEGGSYRSPSISRDGRWMVYNSAAPNETNMFRLRDLNSDADRILDDKGRQPGGGGEAIISPDGSKVVFERDCKGGPWKYEGVPPCSFLVASSGGEAKQVCSSCTPRGFSADGSVELVQYYSPATMPPDRIDSVDLRSGAENEFLASEFRNTYHAFFSWDDRWVVFKKLIDPVNAMTPGSTRAQLMIAPVRDRAAGKESGWIAITDGKSFDDKPQFSPDGRLVYFWSNRDGYMCVWAQRLDQITKRPEGKPFAFEHYHSSPQRSLARDDFAQSDLSVSRDKVLVNLPVSGADTWIAQTE